MYKTELNFCLQVFFWTKWNHSILANMVFYLNINPEESKAYRLQSMHLLQFY